MQVVDRIDRSVPRHEDTNDVEVALLARPVKGRVVVPVSLVHVAAVIDILEQSIQVTLVTTQDPKRVSNRYGGGGEGKVEPRTQDAEQQPRWL